jgi:hypothetical protein
MRLWPYYTNVYYKYTHGSFNINNEIYYYFKNTYCRPPKTKVDTLN